MRELLVIIIVMFLIGLPSVFSFTAQEINDSIILAVPFDEGLAKDVSTENREGTIAGGIFTSSTNTKLGNGSAFVDGSTIDSVVFSADAHMDSILNFTICKWSNLTDTTTFGGGVRRNEAGNIAHEWSLNIDGQGDAIRFPTVSSGGTPLDTTAGSPSGFLANSDWELICGVVNFTNGNLNTYLIRNTTVIASSSIASSSGSATLDFVIGSDEGANTIIGGLDDICYINLSLSTDDISEHIFNGGAGTACASIGEVILDVLIPSFQQDSINNSLPRLNEDILVSQRVIDDIALSEARVSHNQSGVFVNQSSITLSGASFNASDTITATEVKGTVVGYQWWVNDTSGNANTSIVRTFTIQNTPPSDPTIIFPTASLRTILQPLDLNVTFPADADGDAITISYFINGTINSTSSFNVTFNASDGLYFLEVSLDDGNDSSNNVSVLFEIDTTIPSFQDSSINNSLPTINTDVLVGQTIIDNNDLDFYVLAHNQSGLFVNQTFFDISGVSFNATNTITVTASKGTVIAYVWFVNDTLNNINISGEATFTVQNTPPENPVIIFPTASLRTNLQPLDLNVTFPADADGDAITISYFINGTINTTSSSNSTFTADDGLYLLEVSLDDGTDFSNNVSVLFEVDTINPILTLTLPIDASTHSTDIPVDILCTDINPFLLNYTFFNSTFEIIKSVQNSTPVGQEFIIKDLINITGIADGSYIFNTSCSDTHTVNAIPDYQVFDIPNGKKFITPNGVDVLIVLIGQPIGQSINAVKLKDRYTFEFGTTGVRENHTFKVITGRNKIQIIDSEIKGHLIIQNGNDGNWIDFENNDEESTVIVERINDKQVNVHVFSNDFNFNSIGGLNVVTESITLTIDTTVPLITAAVSFETTGTSGILVRAGTIAITLMIIIGVFLELVFRPIRSRLSKRK